jgi:hypothetical protein
MSYRTWVKHDEAGRLIASYRVPADEASPSGDWRVVTEGGEKLLRSRALRRNYIADGRIREKARLRITASGRGTAGRGSVAVEVFGLPPEVPSVRLEVGGQIVEVPNGTPLNVSWNTPTQVTVRLDPSHVEYEARAINILFV